jgi:hypothetical protein
MKLEALGSRHNSTPSLLRAGRRRYCAAEQCQEFAALG